MKRKGNIFILFKKNSTLLIIFLLFLSTKIYSQKYFSRWNISDNKTYWMKNVTEFFHSDVDGDGDSDIIAFRSTDNYYYPYRSKIVWYEKLDSCDTFNSLEYIFVENDEISSLKVIDIDGDGREDIVYTLQDPGKVAWLKNLGGKGNFSEAKVISESITEPKFVEVGDLNSDGYVDVVVRSFEDESLSWFQNLDGNGTFSEKKDIAIGGEDIYQIFLADIDDDGDIDIISNSSYNDDKLFVLKNMNGNGNFSSPIVILTSIADKASVVIVDIDGDGDSDIISEKDVSYHDSETVWYENIDGQGTFGTSNYLCDDKKVIVATDYDKDGDVDILLGEEELIYFENTNGQGNFAEAQTLITDFSKRQFLFLDLNGDDIRDVLSHTYNDDYTISWYEGLDGLGNFSGIKSISKNDYFIADVAYGDIDGDGDEDVVTVCSGKENVFWQENMNGERYFTPFRKIVSYSIEDPKSVDIEDIDGDGNNDIILACGTENRIVILKNLLGNGIFWEESVVTEDLPIAWHVETADMDEDGDLDILATSLMGDRVVWFENVDGAGSFGEQQLIADNIDAPLVALAEDMDNDGDLDVVTISYWDNKIVWNKNIGGGSFTNSITISNSINGVKHIAISDVDMDGYKDIVYASYNDATIGWIKNLGNGNFGEPNIISSSYLGGVCYVSCGDINENGYKDVVVGTLGRVAYYSNLDGEGNFASMDNVISGNSTRLAKLVDFNSDGVLDILTLGGGNSVYWHKNPNENGMSEKSPLQFNVFPNPVKSKMSIISKNNIPDVIFSDMLGKTISHKSISTYQKTADIDISDLVSGIYILKIIGEDGSVGVKKIIKE